MRLGAPRRPFVRAFSNMQWQGGEPRKPLTLTTFFAAVSFHLYGPWPGAFLCEGHAKSLRPFAAGLRAIMVSVLQRVRVPHQQQLHARTAWPIVGVLGPHSAFLERAAARKCVDARAGWVASDLPLRCSLNVCGIQHAGRNKGQLPSICRLTGNFEIRVSDNHPLNFTTQMVEQTLAANMAK